MGGWAGGRVGMAGERSGVNQESVRLHKKTWNTVAVLRVIPNEQKVNIKTKT